MKKTNVSYTTLNGVEAKTKLQIADERIKNNRSTTADVAEGELTFDTKANAKIAFIPFIGRNGKTYDFPAIGCKDSAGEEHWIALSAFRAKDEIIALDGSAILCPNLVGVEVGYLAIFDFIFTCRKIILHRMVGCRNGRKGRYEYFTFEK